MSSALLRAQLTFARAPRSTDAQRAKTPNPVIATAVLGGARLPQVLGLHVQRVDYDWRTGAAYKFCTSVSAQTRLPPPLPN